LQALGIVNDNDGACAYSAISRMPASRQPQWVSVHNASGP
jgi:hypothetical protein